MSTYQVELWSSFDALRKGAERWDDLWRRSDVSVPIAQAEIIAQWGERCATGQRFCAVTLSDGDRLVAGIPMVGMTLGRVLQVGGMPSDPWSNCGELLIDTEAASDHLYDELLNAMALAPWSMFRFSPIPLDTPRWQRLHDRARANGWLVDQHTHYPIGTVAIDHDWTAYEKTRSSNHRRYIRKAKKKADELGNVRLRIECPTTAHEVETLLRRGFEIEDRSWKGVAGTSVLRAPGIFDYYCRQAMVLAQKGQLRLIFLEAGGHEIAFEYGYQAKRTYFSPKVGYNDHFSQLCPGQLIRDQLFRVLHAEQEVDLVDFWGPLSTATARWNTGQYNVGRLAFAPPRLEAKLLFQAYQSGTELAHRFQQWRDWSRKKRGVRQGVHAEGTLEIGDTASEGEARPQPVDVQ